MNDAKIRSELVRLLSGHGAHISFDDAVKGFPLERAGNRISGVEHTMWGLVYHMQLVQNDILEFIRNPDHVSPEYPHGYWPKADAPEERAEWNNTVEQFRTEMAEMQALVSDTSQDLYTPFPHGNGQTLFREAVVLADHNSYHVGQIVDLRMLLSVPVRDW